jgi:putative colanic acid biosynthesis acetyltransferase WcaF
VLSAVPKRLTPFFKVDKMQTDLSKFDVGDYKAGPALKVIIWYFVNYYVFDSAFPWPYKLKLALLRTFGAKVGKGLVIKTKVRIKNPWRLTIGENCWIGESVWIDNLENVVIGSNVSISQGAMLLTGNHDYTISSFPYRLGKIVLEDGVWVGAKSVVCPAVTCKSHSILTVNSVASKDLEAWGIYSGNPAALIRQRKMIK